MKLLTITTLLFLCQRCSAFIKHVPTKEIEVPIDINIKEDLTWRSSEQFEGIPDRVTVEFSVNNQKIVLHLRRNPEITDNVPVLLTRRGKVRKYKVPSSEIVASYDDTNYEASVLIWDRRKDETEEELRFVMFGTFFKNNQTYLIQPPSEGSSSIHTIAQITDDQPVFSDYMKPPGYDEMKISGTRDTETDEYRSRYKRQIEAYEIEVFIVVDFTVYTFWYDKTNGTAAQRNTAAINTIKQFYSFVINAMNIRYQTVTGRGFTITCLFAGIYIADTSSGSSFIPIFATGSGSVRSQIRDTLALDAFKTWANTNLDGTFEYDAAMLFTAYDIISVGSNNVVSTSTAGFAFLGALCGDSRYSINEDHFKAGMVTTAAHELGHNLNANHDGEGNSCSASTGNVMAATSITSLSNSVINKGQWAFSSCSLDSFENYVAFLEDTSNSFDNCMRNRSNNFNASALDDYANDIAGQVYVPDQQCEYIRGSGSYLERSFYNGSFSRICEVLACTSPSNSLSFNSALTWEGTSCGDGKLCEGSNCVESTSAPTGLTENCIFGSWPGNAPGFSQSCAEVLGGTALQAYCYQDIFEFNCCEECNVHRTNNAGIFNCTFGDKIIGCGTLSRFGCYSNEAECCSHCNSLAGNIPGCKYGDKAIGCTLANCADNSELCCETCAPTTTTSTTTTTTTSTTTSTTQTTTSTTTTPPTTTSTTTTPPTTTSTTTTPPTTTSTTTTPPTTTSTTTTPPTTTSTTTTPPTTTSTTTTPPTTTSTTTTPPTTTSTTTTPPTTTSTTTTPPTTTSTTTTPPTTTSTTTTPPTTTSTTTTPPTTTSTTTTTPTTTSTTTTPPTTTSTTTTPPTTTSTTTTPPTTTSTTTTPPTTTSTTTTPPTTTSTTTTPPTTTSTTTTPPTTTSTTTTPPTTTSTTTTPPTTTSTTTKPPTTTSTTTTPPTTTSTTTTPPTTTSTTTTPPTTTSTTTTPPTTTSTTTTPPTTTSTTTTPPTTTSTTTTPLTTTSTTTTPPTTTSTTTTPPTTTSTTTTPPTMTSTTTTPTTTTSTTTAPPTTTSTTTTPPTTTSTTTTPPTTTSTTTTPPTTTSTTTTPPTTTSTTNTPPTTTSTTTTPPTTTSTTTTPPTTTSTTTTPPTTTSTTTTPPTTTSTTTTPPTTTSTTTTSTTTSTTTTTAETTTSTTTATSTTSTSTTTPTTTTTTTSITTTQAAAAGRTQTSTITIFPVTVTNVNFDDTTSASYIQLRDNILIQLRIIYVQVMGSTFGILIINRIRLGSLIVEYTVEYNDDPQGRADFTEANRQMLTGERLVTVANQSVAATSVEIGNTTFTNTTISGSICEMFAATGGCNSGYNCVVVNNMATCEPEKTTSGIALVLAIAVGLPVFLILVLICIGLILRAARMKRLESRTHSKTSSSERYGTHSSEQKFPSVTPYNGISGWNEAAYMTAYPHYMNMSQSSGRRQGQGHGNKGHKKKVKDPGMDLRYSNNENPNMHHGHGRDFVDKRYSDKHHRKHREMDLQNYAYDNNAADFDTMMADTYVKAQYDYA